jgi:hypothetical protein
LPRDYASQTGPEFFIIEFAVARRPRRTATAASNLDAGCHGQTVRDDEGFRLSRASTCVARSRLGATSLHGQDRPLSLALGALLGGLAFRTTALGIELS